MNYNISINQKAITDNSLDIDLTEAFILAAIHQMTSDWDDMERITKNGKTYFWLKYEKIIADNPLLKGRGLEPMKVDTLYRHVKVLCEKGFLEAYSENGKGVKTYFHLTAKVFLTYGSKPTPVIDPKPAKKANRITFRRYGQLSAGVRTIIRTDNNTNTIPEREEKAPESFEMSFEATPSYEKPKPEFIQPVPQDVSDQHAEMYRSVYFPAPFQPADASAKILLYLQNKTNADNFCAVCLFSKGQQFTAEQWNPIISEFVAYQFHPNYYQPKYNANFASLFLSLTRWLKSHKDNLGQQRPSGLKLEEIVSLAEVARNNPENPQNSRKILSEANVRQFFGKYYQKIETLSNGVLNKLERMSAEEFLKLLLLAASAPKIFEVAMEGVVAAKTKTKWLDGFKTVFACIEGQFKYQQKTAKT